MGSGMSTSAANQRLLIRGGLLARKLKALPGFADYAMPSVSQSLQVSKSSTPRSYFNRTSRQLRFLGAEPPGHRPFLINEYAEREQVRRNHFASFLQARRISVMAQCLVRTAEALHSISLRFTIE